MFIASATAEWVLVDVTGDNNCNGKERKCLELMRKNKLFPITGLERSENIPRAREMKLPHSKEINVTPSQLSKVHSRKEAGLAVFWLMDRAVCVQSKKQV